MASSGWRVVLSQQKFTYGKVRSEGLTSGRPVGAVSALPQRELSAGTCSAATVRACIQCLLAK